MNHDYAHCADFTEKCPRSCFRAQLARDLKQNAMQYIGIPMSYIHFREEGLCQCTEDEVEDVEDADSD